MGKTLGIGFAALLVLVVLAYLFMGSDPAPEPEPVSTSIETRPLMRKEERREIPAPAEEVSNTYQLSGDLPALDNSDQPLFKHLSMLLSGLRLGLLKEDQFLRKLVLQIDNAAKGRLVYQHSPFVGPSSYFEVAQEDDIFYVDLDSYNRYDAYGQLVESVDTSLILAFYRFYEPLLDEAYAELGYPEGSFRGTLIQAIDQVLATPIVEGEIQLEQPEANFTYVDESLESLNMVQKQLLRMGPENTQKIQTALLSFKARIQ